MNRDTISTLLCAPSTALLARILLTAPFWINGLTKAFDFAGGVAEMEHLGFAPGVVYCVLTIVLHLVASALIIAQRWTWIAAGALGVFTLLTIALVHRFWMFDGLRHTIALYTAEEHIGMIGGLIAISILAARDHRRMR
ncbi:DoxX family protein [Paraburkholderia flava]|uniref:DoxX family protein n=1 Tax=Paraburkholderia flava TaxID=2547393 RepID=UPI00105BDE06|nr:DoxX family protein [Paraburkholderia flava]